MGREAHRTPRLARLQDRIGRMQRRLARRHLGTAGVEGVEGPLDGKGDLLVAAGERKARREKILAGVFAIGVTATEIDEQPREVYRRLQRCRIDDFRSLRSRARGLRPAAASGKSHDREVPALRSSQARRGGARFLPGATCVRDWRAPRGRSGRSDRRRVRHREREQPTRGHQIAAACTPRAPFLPAVSTGADGLAGACASGFHAAERSMCAQPTASRATAERTWRNRNGGTRRVCGGTSRTLSSFAYGRFLCTSVDALMHPTLPISGPSSTRTRR